MIVKIQRPLATNELVPQVLMYDQSRELMIYLPYDDDMKQQFGDDLKQYWEVELDSTDGPPGTPPIVNFVKQVEDQPW